MWNEFVRAATPIPFPHTNLPSCSAPITPVYHIDKEKYGQFLRKPASDLMARGVAVSIIIAPTGERYSVQFTKRGYSIPDPAQTSIVWCPRSSLPPPHQQHFYPIPCLLI
jgi:hypothetical protein